MDPELQEITKIMASVLTPVFLISAVSVLIAPMALRYGRVIDRVRFLLNESKSVPPSHRTQMHWELKALYSRAQVLRAILISAVTCIALTVMTIVALFSGLMFHLATGRIAVSLFGAALTLLTLTLMLFSRDFAVSLRILRADVHARIGQDLGADEPT